MQVNKLPKDAKKDMATAWKLFAMSSRWSSFSPKLVDAGSYPASILESIQRVRRLNFMQNVSTKIWSCYRKLI